MNPPIILGMARRPFRFFLVIHSANTIIAWTCLGQTQATWTIEPPAMVVGDIPDFPLIEQTFLITNPSPEPLRLQQPSVSCGACLVADLSQTTLDPGHIAILTVTLNPHGRQGPLRQSVTIQSGNGSPSQLVLPVDASVHRQYRIQGGPVAFRTFLQDEVRSHQLQIRSESPTALPMHAAKSDYDGLTTHLETLVDPNQALLHIQTVPDRLREGRVEANIFLYAKHNPDPVYSVPVTCEVVPPFQVTPARLTFADLDREQLRMIFVRQHGPSPCDLSDVSVPSDHFRVRIFPESGLPHYRINVYGHLLAGLHGEMGSIGLTSFCGTTNRMWLPVEVIQSSGRTDLLHAHPPAEEEGP